MNNFHSKKGQSLVEAIGAVAVILVGIITVVSLLIYAIHAAQVASLKNQAHYLAVEGLEIARFVRDTNFLRTESGEVVATPFAGMGGYYDDERYNIPRVHPDAVDPEDRFDYAFLGNSQETCGDHPCRQVIDTSPFYSNKTGGLAIGESPTVFYRWVELYEVCEGNLVMDTVGQDCDFFGLPQIGVRAASHVQFTKGENTSEYVLEETIYNWKYDY